MLRSLLCNRVRTCKDTRRGRTSSTSGAWGSTRSLHSGSRDIAATVALSLRLRWRDLLQRSSGGCACLLTVSAGIDQVDQVDLEGSRALALGEADSEDESDS